MNNEFLKMQKLAGLITESEYKAKVEEEDVMGKVGKSYPAPKKDVLTQPNLGLSPEQYKEIQKQVKNAYQEDFEEDEAEHVFFWEYTNLFFGEGWDEGEIDEDDLFKTIGVDTPQKRKIFKKKQKEVFYDMMGWDKHGYYIK